MSRSRKRRPVWDAPEKKWFQLPSLGRWGDPAALATLATLTGLALYAIVSAAAAGFYRPLGVEPADVNARYPGLLEQSISLLANLLGQGVVVISFALLFGFAVLLPLQGLLGRSKTKRRRVVSAAALVLILLGGGLIARQSPLLWLLYYGGAIALMALRPYVGWFLVLAIAIIAALVVLALSMFAWAAEDRRLVRLGLVPQRFWSEVPARPWRVQAASIEWNDEVPASLRDVKLDCVLVLGANNSGTLVYTSNGAGVRRSFVVPADDALIQRIPELNRCVSWPWEKNPNTPNWR
jgi:hypothetical protein